MQSLDEILSEIAKEPYSEVFSDNELLLMKHLRRLRRNDYNTFARYLHAYNEVRNSKLTQE